jgi:hypothetical protein
MEKQKKKIRKFLNLTKNEVVGNDITHLLKSGSATRSGSVKQYTEFEHLIPKKWRGLPLKYDLWYEYNKVDTSTKRPIIPAFLYTDMLNKCLYFRVPNEAMNTELLNTILLNNHEETDLVTVARITNSLSDKYNLVTPPDTEFYERVVFLPGTNILEDILDFDYVKKLVDNEGAKVKPHPLTTRFHQFILKKKFGEQNILNNSVSGFSYLWRANVVFCCKNSEMGLTALLLNKRICLVDNPAYDNHTTYGSIYDAILKTPHYGSVQALAKILSSEYSGIIHLDDPAAEQKMYNFLNSYNFMIKRP